MLPQPNPSAALNQSLLYHRWRKGGACLGRFNDQGIIQSNGYLGFDDHSLGWTTLELHSRVPWGIHPVGGTYVYMWHHVCLWHCTCVHTGTSKEVGITCSHIIHQTLSPAGLYVTGAHALSLVQEDQQSSRQTFHTQQIIPASKDMSGKHAYTSAHS